MWFHTGHKQWSPVRVFPIPFTSLLQTFLLNVLLHHISSFAAIMIATVIRGHHLAKNVNMGHNKLLSPSTYSIWLFSWLSWQVGKQYLILPLRRLGELLGIILRRIWSSGIRYVQHSFSFQLWLLESWFGSQTAHWRGLWEWTKTAMLQTVKIKMMS